MSESNFWYGHLDAGEKSSPVLMDRRLSTANPNTIYVFNLQRSEIIEYRRDIIEPKLRDLAVEEHPIIKKLESAYSKVCSDFIPRGIKISNLPEKGAVTKASKKSSPIESEEMDYDELVTVDDADGEEEVWLEDED